MHPQRWLNNNQFSGSIPDEIQNLRNLEVLLVECDLLDLITYKIRDLAINQITGCLPLSICNLTRLTDMQVSKNIQYHN